MKFVLLLHGNEGRMLSLSSDEIAASMSAYAAFSEAMQKAGIIVGGERLRSSADSACVERRNDGVRVIDGPYSDTKEQLGGYLVIEVASREAAIEWAGRCPAAAVGTVEVRPVWEG